MNIILLCQDKFSRNRDKKRVNKNRKMIRQNKFKMIMFRGKYRTKKAKIINKVQILIRNSKIKKAKTKQSIMSKMSKNKKILTNKNPNIFLLSKNFLVI